MLRFLSSLVLLVVLLLEKTCLGSPRTKCTNERDRVGAEKLITVFVCLWEECLGVLQGSWFLQDVSQLLGGDLSVTVRYRLSHPRLMKTNAFSAAVWICVLSKCAAIWQLNKTPPSQPRTQNIALSQCHAFRKTHFIFSYCITKMLQHRETFLLHRRGSAQTDACTITHFWNMYVFKGCL